MRAGILMACLLAAGCSLEVAPDGSRAYSVDAAGAAELIRILAEK